MSRPNTSTSAWLLAALGVALTGCGGQQGPELAAPAVTTTPSSTQSDAALPKSYAFTLTSSGGERGLIGDYRVRVRDERVTSVENLNDDYPYEPKLFEIPTLQDLVDRAESARTETVVEFVEFVVDDTGVPQSLSLDPVPNAIDDKECYEVSHFEAAD